MTCVGKKKYQTMEFAIRTAEILRKKKKDSKNLQAYPCPICRCYHIGNVQGVRA